MKKLLIILGLAISLNPAVAQTQDGPFIRGDQGQISGMPTHPSYPSQDYNYGSSYYGSSQGQISGMPTRDKTQYPSYPSSTIVNPPPRIGWK